MSDTKTGDVPYSANLCLSLHMSGSRSVGPTERASHGNLLKMQIFLLHPRPTEPETVSIIISLCFNKPSRWLWYTLKRNKLSLFI